MRRGNKGDGLPTVPAQPLSPDESVGEGMIVIDPEACQGDEQGQQFEESARREYYLLEEDAPPDAPVQTVEAEDAVEASEIFLPEIRASLPHPPWEDGEPQRPLGPDIRVAINEEEERFVVGEVEWPGEELTHGELWASFTDDELREFREEWEHVEREWHERFEA